MRKEERNKTIERKRTAKGRGRSKENMNVIKWLLVFSCYTSGWFGSWTCGLWSVNYTYRVNLSSFEVGCEVS